jgi:hypothetical protein
MEHQLKITSLHDALAECSCGGWSMASTGARTKDEIETEHERHAVAAPGKDIRELWTKRGVPQQRQNAILQEVDEKAKPGAMVGPFKIPE